MHGNPEAECSFIYVCKTSSHKYLYEWVEEFTAQELGERYERKWDGKKRVVYRYRYRNGVPLKDGDEAMQVNLMELSILDKEGTIKKRFSFITDLPITDINITRMISYGRSRWKIENENNNILKTKGSSMSGLYLKGLFRGKSACVAALNFSNNDNESTFYDLFSADP
jgi:hypothetical protein